ncbi:hypothetical protein ACFYZJ_20875 [Streptomyces sp. NPDC001848]|uniref:hypothetical protein n=1 Tax=Streptomyces sp. NPDC001848 TaxID=3364618 RepID=UPI00369E1DDE
MNFRPWVAAPLVGATIALVAPAADVAAQTSARHASGPLWLHEGDGDHGHRNPWRHCHSRRRVVLIDKGLRAILTNGRRGPEALVLQGSSSSSAWPTAPWDTWSVSTYLDVNYPTQTTNQYEFRIRGFFRVHPIFEVKAFDRHERDFRFPAAHCVDDEDGGDRGHRGDRGRPHGGGRAEGRGSSGSVAPQEGDHRENGGSGQGNPAGGGAAPPGAAPRDTAAAACGVGLLSVKNILIAAGGVLMILGMAATAWLRRRRSAA